MDQVSLAWRKASARERGQGGGSGIRGRTATRLVSSESVPQPGRLVTTSTQTGSEINSLAAARQVIFASGSGSQQPPSESVESQSQHEEGAI